MIKLAMNTKMTPFLLVMLFCCLLSFTCWTIAEAGDLKATNYSIGTFTSFLVKHKIPFGFEPGFDSKAPFITTDIIVPSGDTASREALISIPTQLGYLSSFKGNRLILTLKSISDVVDYPLNRIVATFKIENRPVSFAISKLAEDSGTNISLDPRDPVPANDSRLVSVNLQNVTIRDVINEIAEKAKFSNWVAEPYKDSTGRILVEIRYGG